MLLIGATTSLAQPASWREEWPRTDFLRRSVDLGEIVSGGPPKDGIPAIDDPLFTPVSQTRDLAARAPVISVAAGGEAKAYPLRIMIWHEIVDDTVGGGPIAVTWCPLCNSSVVFDRRLGGRILSFGTTGKLRNSDLVMYDRQTESWWQQFTGEAIVGAMTGQRLRLVPSRLESFERFQQRFPRGQVLVPNNPGARNYGRNPYVGYDATGQRPFLYDGTLPGGIEPMERVVAVETAPGRHEAWALALLRRKGTLQSADLLIQWQPGQASALDKASIRAGRDVGNVVVQRKQENELVDVPYDVTFAFVFHAFRPNSTIHKDVYE